MIEKNSTKKFEFTLKAINSCENPYIVKKHGEFTKIHEDKKIYLYLENNGNLRQLEVILKKIFFKIKDNINVCTKSFLEIFDKDKERVLQIIIESAMYSNYDKVSLKKEKSNKNNINIMFCEKYNDLFDKTQIKMEFLNYVRDLQNMPPNIANSIWIADELIKKSKSIPNLKVTVLNKKQVQDLKMGLLLSVNAGSQYEPRVVIMEYCSDPSLPKNALIGKGITFDTGGYNLKSTKGLVSMKFDMSGGAIVSSTVMAIAKAKLKANVCSVALFTDNCIGATGTVPESIITSMNGATVEVGDTDAEGRLVLADGITYAVRNLNADRIIDVSTLTGSIIIALGRWWTGTFSYNDEFHNELEKAANKANEYIWRMPVIPELFEWLVDNTRMADFNNVEEKYEAPSSIAACFLDYFAEKKPFIHLDIAGTGSSDMWGNAPMVKTLFELNNN